MKTTLLLAEAIALSLLVLLVAGCGQKETEKSSPNALPKDFVQSEMARDRARFADSKAPEHYDVTRYNLSGRFNWSTLVLDAKVEVHFQPLFKNLKELVLDSRVAEVTEVTSNGKALPFEYKKEEETLKIDLASVTPEIGQTSQVVIAYKVQANSSKTRYPDSALNAVLPRTGDPVASEVVGTFSEPLGAASWMPCHNKVSDRAEFSVDMILPVHHSLISNGDLLQDSVEGNYRRVKYSTRYSLPTYLMAFAEGAFQKTTKMHGNLPVSLWSRRGLPIKAEPMIDEIIREIKVFEALLVPFPFEKYTLVLLPEFTGGIEHAGITFQGETSSTQSHLSRDVGLTSHELGHQWFGDYVTVADWDDLWIKEGMASLLGEESTRPWEDKKLSGRLFGQKFFVAEGEAVIDPELHPDDKYTNGPYGRAAWVLTQIRSLVGEKTFWSILKRVLTEHAFGTISTDEFIAYFAPSLGAPAMDSFKKALRAKKLPSFVMNGELPEVVDPEGALVAPVVIEKTLTGYLTIDRTDTHPFWAFENDKKVYEKNVSPLFVPKGDEGVNEFLKLSVNQQWAAFGRSELWDVTPTQFQKIVDALGSEEVRFMATQTACEILNKNPAERSWSTVLAKLLAKPAVFGMPERLTGKGLSKCSPDIIQPLFKNRLALLAKSPENVDETLIALLSMLDTPADTTFSLWSGVTERGASVRARLMGVNALNKHLNGVGGHNAPGETTKTEWKSYYHALLEKNEVGEVLGTALQGIRGAKDVEALPAITALMKRHQEPRFQSQVVCAVWDLVEEDKAKFQKFVGDLGSLEVYAPWIRKMIENPEKCG